MRQKTPVDRPTTGWAGILATIAASVFLSACGSPATAPTGSTASPAGAASEPELRVTIGALGSVTAIAALSEVRFEARIADNAKLKEIHVDFGDGSGTNGAAARHVYAEAGTYTATATFLSTSGFTVTASHTVVVKAVSGLWSHAAFNPASRRFEIRRLTLSQHGSTLEGVLWTSGDAERSVVGALSGERSAQLIVAGQTLEGVVPSIVSGEGALWPLRVQGGTADTQTLTFAPAPTGAPGPPPTAVLSVTAPHGFVVQGLDVNFDGSRSTGEGLTHFLEFGDDAYTTDTVVNHALARGGDLVARLTVVDRFGRVAVATQRLTALSIVNSSICWWANFFINSGSGRHESRRITLGNGQAHDGRTLVGGYHHPEGFSSRLSGVLSGSQEIRLILDGGGIEFVGAITRSSQYENYVQLNLTARGGSADGRSLVFQHDCY